LNLSAKQQVRPRTGDDPPKERMEALTSEQRLARAQRVARLWDGVIRVPGTPFSIGLDPLLGLIPGAGDAVAAGVTGWLVLEAARLGVPASTLVRMLTNVAIDALIGAIPVAGDVFDFAWKANLRNVALLERHVAEPAAARRAGRGWLFAVGAALTLLVAGAVVLGVLTVRALLRRG
jgi:hypothetical protein